MAVKKSSDSLTIAQTWVVWLQAVTLVAGFVLCIPSLMILSLISVPVVPFVWAVVDVCKELKRDREMKAASTRTEEKINYNS